MPSWNPARKLRGPAALVPLVRRAQARGRRVVFTNGCYDLLHRGHVDLLRRARAAGDVLIVAVNSDRSVRAMGKAPRRPIVGQRDRALLVAALEAVDYVTVFDDETPARLIARLQPDVLVKGADWAARDIVGADTVRRRGGRVVRFPLLQGYSTSRLITRIRGG
jgi:rfaE bifunctional protein nucleotidyltransferase chain/domain